MHRYAQECFLVLLMTVSLVSGVAAQEDSYAVPPDYPGVQIFIPGIFVPPVPGAPFSATVEILSKQTLPNGSIYTRWCRYLIARNSAGVIHNERRDLEKPGFQGEPPIQHVHIYNPQTHLDTILNPKSYVARQITLAELKAPANSTLATAFIPQNTANPTSSDLGIETMAGIVLHGTRKQWTVPAAVSGTSHDVTVTDDYWYSDDLKVYLVLKHNDPRTGEQMVGIVKLDRQEPDLPLFQIPSTYKLVDETPVRDPLHPTK
jgi:hypothetical protein